MKTRNIDRLLSQVVARSWDEGDAKALASRLCLAFPGALISWDEGDEDWIQIYRNEVICYIHTRRPLLMVSVGALDAIQKLLRGEVTVLDVESWDVSSLSASLELLRKVFPDQVLPDAFPGRSADKFSAEELWFATN